MAKIFNQLLSKIGLRNATTSTGSSSQGVAVNRDPKTTQVKKISYAVKSGSGTDAESPNADFTAIATAISRDSYLMQAVLKYTELVFKSGFQYQGKNEQSLTYLNQRISMMEIATQQPMELLYHGIADDIVKYSNSFIVKARAKNGVGLAPGLPAIAILPSKDPVAGYFRLPPQQITITRDDLGNISKYTQTSGAGGDTKDFKPEDIIHIKVNCAAGEAFGMPWLAPVIEDIRLLRKIEENSALLLYRHIFPLLTYTVGVDKPGFEATPEELDELRGVIEQMPTDGAIVLPERHKVAAVNIQPIDGNPYLTYFENRVFSGLGLSQVDFGRGDTANRNTADAMSGNKADRVKGWQQVIQPQIDKYMIDEILIEGGFDPVVNPDFDVNFVFVEIEQEMRIKIETHEIYKFEHNIQTWDETRKNIGLDPVADESRLIYQMIGFAQAEQQAAIADKGAETDNKQKPANQNGSRTGPKKSTESVLNESDAPKETSPTELLYSQLLSVYESIEKDVLDEVGKFQENERFPIRNTKELLSSIHFGKDKMLNIIQREAKQVFSEGIRKARTELDLSRSPKVNMYEALNVISAYNKDSFNLMDKTIHSMLDEKLKHAKNKVEALLVTKGIFESLKHRIQSISKTSLLKSHHYGYALALSRAGVAHIASICEEGGCDTCYEKSRETIELVELSAMNEAILFYQIPPFHPHCECDLKISDKGGE